MWYLKTKLGTFWVLEAKEADEQLEDNIFLGINDEELGLYEDIEDAVRDVHDQATGYLRWDTQSRVNAPSSISQWIEGTPDNWLH